MHTYTADFSDRIPAPGVDPLFYQRWSPRAFKKIAIPEQNLTAIFDAARWSPSCYNEQPWLFVTSSRLDDFDIFLRLLLANNQSWAKNASLIGFIFAKKTFTHNGVENNLSVFDCGAAWMALTLQAAKYGIYAHGMGGIKRDIIASTLNISTQDFDLICGFALGVIDLPDTLDKNTKLKEKPSPRKPLDAIWQQGIKS